MPVYSIHQLITEWLIQLDLPVRTVTGIGTFYSDVTVNGIKYNKEKAQIFFLFILKTFDFRNSWLESDTNKLIYKITEPSQIYM
jgi:hypothetical protein